MADHASQAALGRGRPVHSRQSTHSQDYQQQDETTSSQQHQEQEEQSQSPPIVSYIDQQQQQKQKQKKKQRKKHRSSSRHSHSSDPENMSNHSSSSSSSTSSSSSSSHSETEDTPSSEDSPIDRGEELVRRRNEYTLKDRQDAYNIEHPFGLPIWKPALYKKDRSVTRNAETAVHLDPSQARYVSTLLPGNVVWAVFCGIPLFILTMLPVPILLIVPWGGPKYSRVIYELATYLLWPFGRYVERTNEDEDDDDDNDQNRNNIDTTTGATTTSSPGAGITENTPILPSTIQDSNYGTATSATSTTAAASSSNGPGPHIKLPHGHSYRVRALGRLTYWAVFYLFIGPILFLFCLLCWACVFTVPMAKLLWILCKNLGNEPLALHFRSPPPALTKTNYRFYPLKPGQPAPPASDDDYAPGRITGSQSIVLLCTYRAFGLQYYKYTIDGVNIIFVNLVPLIIFAILDFFLLNPYVAKHPGLAANAFLSFITSHAFIFVVSLLSVIPLSYFIGMAVASISAQSSIGMGAVINATFGSIIEVILYSIALTEHRASLVEGSIVGSLLAGVLLMPGSSMIAGAWRRKEQRFNARSAGVTSTMLIMAIVGALTPTLFYQIYGPFQLSCEGCPPGLDVNPDTAWQCKRCFYEHHDPIDEPFYRNTVKSLVHYCAIILVLSYLIGLWFSLRTHASQIWHTPAAEGLPLTGPGAILDPNWQSSMSSIKQRSNPNTPAAINQPVHQYLFLDNSKLQQQQQDRKVSSSTTSTNTITASVPAPITAAESTSSGHLAPPTLASSPTPAPVTTTTSSSSSSSAAAQVPPASTSSDALPSTSAALTTTDTTSAAAAASDNVYKGVSHLSPEEVDKAFRVVAATATAFGRPAIDIPSYNTHALRTTPTGTLRWDERSPSVAPNRDGRSLSRPSLSQRRMLSAHDQNNIGHPGQGGNSPGAAGGGGHGGHDAPNWTRLKSASVLLICTVLFAAIAEILVDVVDVVLEGSGIPEKLLGITLFALVPNAAEFMNAMSFALNGNIALSMEIGSQYCLQVCLLQIPAMIAFTWFYSIGKDSMLGRGFSLVLPKFDVFAIIIAVFLLTYVYLEARSNYYRGSILVLSYLVLLGGFVFAPANTDDEDNPLFINLIKNFMA